MPFTLEQVVPWGRSLDEYQRMFSLSSSDRGGPILGCADGPASFNVELTKLGGDVVSCDPIYAFTAEEIRQRIRETMPRIVEQARQHQDTFVWSAEIPDVDALAEYRTATMNRFLEDFEQGLAERRLVASELPDLPSFERQFRLAVCSHFLFLYSDHLSEQFHVASIRRLLELALEVRVFPVLGLDGKLSPHLEPVAKALSRDGFHAELEIVAYEFQKGGNQMLRVRRE